MIKLVFIKGFLLRDKEIQEERIAVLSSWCKQKFSFYVVYKYLLCCITLLPVWSFATCHMTDDMNHIIHLAKPAQRIISLAPDITEILFSIGAGDRIIGVVKGSDFPKAARKISLVGSYLGLDLEKIISLHPDLIVTWNQSFSRQLGLLKELGIPIYTTVPRRLEDIPRTMENLACLTGNKYQAHQQAKAYLERLRSLRKKYHGEKRVTVFYQIGNYSLITINRDSWINQVITLCGGYNIFAEVSFIAPEVSWESVVIAHPQVILSDANDANWKKRWEKWLTIPAVKNHLLFAISSDLISRAGPRLLQGAEQICFYLQLARS